METKKAKILAIVAVAVFAVFVIGATYAYFQITGNNSASANIRAETASVDTLNFKLGKDINLGITQSEFAKGVGNKSDSTTGTATLTASNSKNIESTTDRYNIYFVIEENDFEYTTDNATPELLLKVTDPNGNEVENITGLVHTENGFDITTRTGGFLVTADYDISALRGETTTQEWTVKVTFANLDTDQIKNTGKTLSGKIYMIKQQMSSYELTKINSIEPTTTYNSITADLIVEEGSAEIDKYYFGIEKISSDTTGYVTSRNTILKIAATDVTYVETDKPTYTFKNLEDNTTYKIYSYGIDKYKMKTNLYETEITTNEYTNAKVNSLTSSVTLNSITLAVNATKGDNDIVKYFYSKDNGATYEESTSNTYVFSGLTDTTEYKIKVKVLDSYGRYSTEYYEAIATETYILPTITNVTATTKWNQISLTVNATDGTNNVNKYYYSINNGAYIEGLSTYTFADLTENTTYSVKIKVEDTKGKASNEYSTSFTTDEYNLPKIKSVSTSSTYNSITINTSGTNGTGTITKYYYSKDNGSNYIESTSSSYTFSNLTSNTTFYLKVKVIDSNGKYSEEYSVSKTTLIANKTSSQMLSALGKTVSSGSVDLSKSSCSSGCDESTNGIYQAQDSYGTTYYWRGTVNDNWVYFAGYYWRIVRINGDGSVRLIYNGKSASTTGTGLQISTSAFTPDNTGTYGIGYTYTANQQRPSTKNGGTSSTIKTVVDNWYNSNLTSYSTYILQNASYCNDREAGSGYTWQTSPSTIFFYAARDRFVFNYNPTFKCNNTYDEYTQKIGILNADEVIYAGAHYSSTNTSYYLYTGFEYWTMTPVASLSNSTYMWLIETTGVLGNRIATTELGVRPVINLKNNVNFTGNGTASSPYKVIE